MGPSHHFLRTFMKAQSSAEDRNTAVGFAGHTLCVLVVTPSRAHPFLFAFFSTQNRFSNRERSGAGPSRRSQYVALPFSNRRPSASRPNNRITSSDRRQHQDEEERQQDPRVHPPEEPREFHPPEMRDAEERRAPAVRCRRTQRHRPPLPTTRLMPFPEEVCRNKGEDAQEQQSEFPPFARTGRDRVNQGRTPSASRCRSSAASGPSWPG